MISLQHDYAYVCELYMRTYVNYICKYYSTKIIIHMIFVINKYVILKWVSVRIKCIISSYQIYIRNAVAHKRMKCNSHLF